MSIRLDPRRLGVLKQLAAEADTRPGDLVRIWVEERLDAEKRGQALPAGAAGDLSTLLTALTERVAALEAASESASATPSAGSASPAATADATPGAPTANGDRPRRPSKAAKPPKRARNKVAAAPSGERVALHDEVIAVITERGPLPAAEIAAAIVKRGRYAPPRSGKPLDAATVNARVSNPTYRARFTRAEGRIGLSEG